MLQLHKDFIVGDIINGRNMSKLSLNTTLNSSNDTTKAVIASGDEATTSTSTSSLNGSGNNTFVMIKSIAEFPLSLPILGFDIVNAAVRRYKCGISDDYLIDELEDYDDENQSLYCVVVKMYTVQPSSLQECYVLYQPTVSSVSTEVKSTISGQSQSSDVSLISIDKDESTITTDLMKVGASSATKSQTSPQVVSLMTPDSFNSLGKKSPETVSSEVMYALFMLANANTSPDLKKKSLEGINLKNIINNKVIEQQEKDKIRKSVEMQNLTQQVAGTSLGISQESLTPRTLNNSTTTTVEEPLKPGEALASGGSSPSREVQEILSLKENDCINEYFDDSDNPAILDDDVDEEEEEDLLEFGEKPLKTVTKLATAPPMVENNLGGGVDNVEIVKLSNSDWPQIPEVPVNSSMMHVSAAASVSNVVGPPPNIVAGGVGTVSAVQMELMFNKMDQLTSE